MRFSDDAKLIAKAIRDAGKEIADAIREAHRPRHIEKEAPEPEEWEK